MTSAVFQIIALSRPCIAVCWSSLNKAKKHYPGQLNMWHAFGETWDGL